MGVQWAESDTRSEGIETDNIETKQAKVQREKVTKRNIIYLG
jgi:hypothetical protein